MLREVGDVLEAFAQRRQPQRDDIQPEKQILAEEALADLAAQILMGRGDDADIGLDGRAAANRDIFALLQYAQKPCLRLHRHVADLIEEEGASLGLLEAPGEPLIGAGECPLFVAEQFALDEIAGNCRHVDGNERALFSFAVIMQRAGDKLLAGAGFAGDHHSEVGLHQARQGSVDFLHGGGAPH